MSPEAGPRCLLIADSTLGGIVPFLASTDDLPAIKGEVAPFDQVDRLLVDGSDPAWRLGADLALVWTRPRSACPSFGRLLDFEPVGLDAILAEVDGFAERLRAASGRVQALFVPTWTLPPADRGLGMLNLDPGVGPAYALLRMNARLAERVAEDPRIHLLDAGRWLALAGPEATHPKLWHFGKIAFGPPLLRIAAGEIKASVRGIAGKARKLVVLDLDDTLWGGIVGDLGWEGLTLGGHHPAGEAFVAFQKGLKALTRRGLILALLSKNTEAVALEAIDRHPEMVLRRPDFAGWRINWGDKAGNLVDLAAELKIGLDAVVFIDDNPAERARVREALPDVFVPDWPADKLLYERALRSLACFDAPSLNAEDRGRARTYATDRERTSLRAASGSIESYLASLGLRVRVEDLGPENLPRAAQLLNKTNQLNLTTRRLTEAELLAWSRAEGNRVLVFRVSDRFDDYGLTGIAGFSAEGGGRGVVSDFVLSCRVMGKGVEEAMVKALIDRAASSGLEGLVATYRPTPRNAPTLGFFAEKSGLTAGGPGAESTFTWDLGVPYAGPSHVEIEGGGPA